MGTIAVGRYADRNFGLFGSVRQLFWLSRVSSALFTMAQSALPEHVAIITNEDEAVAFLTKEGVSKEKAKRVLVAAREGKV